MICFSTSIGSNTDFTVPGASFVALTFSVFSVPSRPARTTSYSPGGTPMRAGVTSSGVSFTLPSAEVMDFTVANGIALISINVVGAGTAVIFLYPKNPPTSAITTTAIAIGTTGDFFGGGGAPATGRWAAGAWCAFAVAGAAAPAAATRIEEDE